LLNKAGTLLIQGMGKTEVLNASFTSIFTRMVVLQGFKVLGNKRQVWSKAGLLFVEEDQVRKYLGKLDIHKSMGPAGVHL